jgi:hypothetical protein
LAVLGLLGLLIELIESWGSLRVASRAVSLAVVTDNCHLVLGKSHSNVVVESGNLLTFLVDRNYY